MRAWTAVVLMSMVMATAQAEIYRWVDEAGTVHFSDTPRPGAKKVELPPVSTYKSEPSSRITPAETRRPGEQQQYSLDIIQPAEKETLRSNQGDVEVAFSVQPNLPVANGFRIAMQLDGQQTSSTTVLHYKLTGVDRGTHTLAAWVEGPDGSRVSDQASVTFYLHQHSTLFSKPRLPGSATPPPGNTPKPVPPKPSSP